MDQPMTREQQLEREINYLELQIRGYEVKLVTVMTAENPDANVITDADAELADTRADVSELCQLVAVSRSNITALRNQQLQQSAGNGLSSSIFGIHTFLTQW